MLDGTKWPATENIRTQYGAIVATQFDFRQKMSTNVEQLRARAAKINKYGITVGEDVICLVIRANIEWAAEQP